MNIVDKLIYLAEQQARTVLLQMKTSLMPSWVIIDSKGDPHIRTTPWANDREKHLAAMAIRIEIMLKKAKAYSFVTEAWSASAPQGFDPDTDSAIPEKDRPMNRPDRQEVVLAFASDGKRKVGRRWFIRRNWNDQIVSLEPDEGNVDQAMGWMTEML